jgi:hypothetical protein
VRGRAGRRLHRFHRRLPFPSHQRSIREGTTRASTPIVTPGNRGRDARRSPATWGEPAIPRCHDRRRAVPHNSRPGRPRTRAPSRETLIIDEARWHLRWMTSRESIRARSHGPERGKNPARNVPLRSSTAQRPSTTGSPVSAQQTSLFPQVSPSRSTRASRSCPETEG